MAARPHSPTVAFDGLELRTEQNKTEKSNFSNVQESVRGALCCTVPRLWSTSLQQSNCTLSLPPLLIGVSNPIHVLATSSGDHCMEDESDTFGSNLNVFVITFVHLRRC